MDANKIFLHGFGVEGRLGWRKGLGAVLTGVALALLTAGCQTTPTLHSESKAGIDFSGYQTFAVLPLTVGEAGADAVQAQELGSAAEQAAAEVLTAKGLKPADRERAHLIVMVRGRSLPKIDFADWAYEPRSFGSYGWKGGPGYAGYTGPQGAAVSDHHYNRRVVAEAYDGQSRELLWVGWLTGAGSGKPDAEIVRATVQQVLAQFPQVRRSARR